MVYHHESIGWYPLVVQGSFRIPVVVVVKKSTPVLFSNEGQDSVDAMELVLLPLQQIAIPYHVV